MYTPPLKKKEKSKEKEKEKVLSLITLQVWDFNHANKGA